MIEIKVHHIHEWRPGHADLTLVALLQEGILIMNDIAARLTASVDNLALALGNQSAAIDEVASAIRNHPASTTDNGALSSLAARLEGITASVNDSAAQLQGLAGEENVEDAGGAEPPVEPAPPVGDGSASGDGSALPPVDDGSGGAPLGDDAGAGSDMSGSAGADASGGDAGMPAGSEGSDSLPADPGPDVGSAGSGDPDTASGDGFNHEPDPNA